MNDNFSTGPQLRTNNGSHLLLLIQNTNSTRATVTVNLVDLQNSRNTISRTITIDPNSTRTLFLMGVPRLFEVTFERVPSGVYFTANIGRGSASNFMTSQSFSYNDFINTTDED